MKPRQKALFGVIMAVRPEGLNRIEETIMADGNGSFVHLELCTPDLKKAQSFYTDMFGWKFHDMDMGPNGIYSTFKPEEGPGGGVYSMPGAPTAWLAYIGVDDIDAATEKAQSLGATVIREVTEVPQMGWLSILVDPTGATLALWEAMPRQA